LWVARGGRLSGLCGLHSIGDSWRRLPGGPDKPIYAADAVVWTGKCAIRGDGLDGHCWLHKLPLAAGSKGGSAMLSIFCLSALVLLHEAARTRAVRRGASSTLMGTLIMACALSGSCRDRIDKPRIVVEARVLKYFEGKEVVEFQIDRFPKGRVVYVPGSERWRREMPEWAKQRREEILAEMKRLAKKYEFEWEDY